MYLPLLSNRVHDCSIFGVQDKVNFGRDIVFVAKKAMHTVAETERQKR
jgi:hypothetical protein